jgi:hypothetical protein
MNATITSEEIATQAGREWQRNHEGCRDAFLSERVWQGFRQLELRGQLRGISSRVATRPAAATPSQPSPVAQAAREWTANTSNCRDRFMSREGVRGLPRRPARRPDPKRRQLEPRRKPTGTQPPEVIMSAIPAVHRIVDSAFSRERHHQQEQRVMRFAAFRKAVSRQHFEGDGGAFRIALDLGLEAEKTRQAIELILAADHYRKVADGGAALIERREKTRDTHQQLDLSLRRRMDDLKAEMDFKRRLVTDARKALASIEQRQRSLEAKLAEIDTSIGRATSDVVFQDLQNRRATWSAQLLTIPQAILGLRQRWPDEERIEREVAALQKEWEAAHHELAAGAASAKRSRCCRRANFQRPGRVEEAHRTPPLARNARWRAFLGVDAVAVCSAVAIPPRIRIRL